MNPPLPGQLFLPLPGLYGSSSEVAEGERLREEGIARAQGGAPAIALWEAVAAVRLVALRRETLTSDDVWLALEALWAAGAMSFREPRVMGAVFKVAEREGYVVATEEHRLSRRPVCHRRPIRVWRSLLYRGVPHREQREGVPA